MQSGYLVGSLSNDIISDHMQWGEAEGPTHGARPGLRERPIKLALRARCKGSRPKIKSAGRCESKSSVLQVLITRY